MAVHPLVNRYFLACCLVGEVRLMRQRAHEYKIVYRLSAKEYRVPRAEFLESITVIETLLQMEVTQPDRWYQLPLYNIWGRVEVAQRHKARQIS